ncbi:MAG: DUF1330 domain-containing protein [Myxococcota bacterium]|nr:DUF1330 domain-containing protein [Myxococcota bacterium]
MSAFFLFDNLEVTDPQKLDEYVQAVRPVVEEFGGRYRVVGGCATTLEGDWGPAYPVMIEFEGVEQARAWYDSDAYRELKALRQSAVKCNAVLIEGV